jgi:serine/threonine protein phosphatase PrpC
MLYKSFSATATGISHTKYGKGCEDFSLHYPSSQVKSALFALAVVADGHGDETCFRSARGAKFAAAAARDAVVEFATRLERWPSKEISEKHIHDLVKHIIASWHGKVETDYTGNPFKDEELAKIGEKYRKRYAAGHDVHHAYGTTLIAAAITGEYWFGIHIGDGRFTALYRDGTFAQPVPWDERCYLNVTTSICDDDAVDRARIYYAPASEKLPAAVFLCSDGIDDNYPVEENEKYLYKLYRTIALTFAEDGFDSTCGQLKDLANSFATKGKGDDTSIAGIIDMEAIKTLTPVLREQVQADEQKAAAEKIARAENARITAKKAARETSIERANGAKLAEETATKVAAKQFAPEKPSVERPAAGYLQKSITTKKALAAIEAYKKQETSYSGPDPKDYGEFQKSSKN